MKVPAVLVESLFSKGMPASPGSFKYWSSEDRAGLNFVCPCGCGSILGVEFGIDR